MHPNVLSTRDRTAIIIAAGAFFICITMGVRQSFGLFLPPYTETLGMGRDTFSFAIAMQNIVWGFASPLFGALADRRGPVLAVALGGLLYTAGLLLMAMAGSGATFTLAQMLIGGGMAGAGFSVILGTVGKVVAPEKRSFALAIVTAAGSFGQFAVVPLAQQGIELLGARQGVFLLAALTILLILAAPLLRLPANAPKARASESNTAVLKTAFASKSYVLLSLGFFVCGFQVVFISTHLPAYVNDAGLPVSAAVTALALIGLFNILGTLVCGWVGDKMPKKDALAIFYVLRSIVIIIFLLLPLSSFTVALFGAAIGFLWLGTVPLTSGLVAVFFGARHMSMLYGIVFLSHQAGSFMGAWLGGVLYEATGSYDIVWYIAIVLGGVAAALHYPIREKSDSRYSANFG